MYSDIPIHIRLSERWLVDPEYNAKRYYHDIELKHDHGRTPYTDRKKEPTVPESVIEYARKRPVGGGQRDLIEIAGALKIPSLRLFDLCRYADIMEAKAAR